MSADLLQFLKNKFMDELEEAEEEHLPPYGIPLHPYFQQIRQVLENYSITTSTRTRMKDCLYDLSIALSDCIVFLENRKTKINKDSSQGQGQGHYSLPELWFLWKTKSKLIRINKKLLVAASHPVALEQTSLPAAITDVATSSSSSSSLSLDGPPRVVSFYVEETEGFTYQAEKIAKLFLGTSSELDEEGFSKEIGIVGIGGCGKTTLAGMLYYGSEVSRFFDWESDVARVFQYDSRIWINLGGILKGEIDLKKIVEAMLKQCDDGGRDLVDGGVEVEGLLDALHEALRRRKSYLIVFDGVWDINLDWYWRLKERLLNKSNFQNRRGIIIVTTRLPVVAKRMVGPNNLYHMQPLSNKDIWTLCREVDLRYRLPGQHPIMVKMKDEITYHSHGLPLAGWTFSTILFNHTFGGDFKEIEELLEETNLQFHLMINPKDDADQGKDLLLSILSMARGLNILRMGWGQHLSDISEVAPQSVLDALYEWPWTFRERLRILIFGGDATTNRVLQVVCDMVHDWRPPIAVMPLGTQVNISISLGWGNQISYTDSKPAFFLRKLMDAEEILIDSWNFVTRTSIPNDLEMPDTLHVQHVSEEDLLHLGGDKDLCGRFWNYLIIGLDAQEWFGASRFKRWPRNIALPISVKIKNHQHQWKKLKLPRSIRSIVCLNMPSFPGGLDPWGNPNFRRKKEKNFTPSFVDDELLEIIGYKDSWNGENFLPLNGHGTRLAQAHQIRFELCKGIAKHIYMSFDGTTWRQPTPIDDDNYLIEISYLSKTKMLATSTSKCKHKSRSPTPIDKTNKIDKRKSRSPTLIDKTNKIDKTDKIYKINEIDKTYEIDKIDKINETNKTDEIDETDKIYHIEKIDEIDEAKRD